MLLSQIARRPRNNRLTPAEAVELAQTQGFSAVIAIQRMGDPTRLERALLSHDIAPRTWTGDRYGDRWDVDPDRGGPTTRDTGHYVTFKSDGLYHAFITDREIGQGSDDWVTALNLARGRTANLAPAQTGTARLKAILTRGKSPAWVNFATARQLDWTFAADYFETEVGRYLTEASNWPPQQLDAAREGLPHHLRQPLGCRPRQNPAPLGLHHGHTRPRAVNAHLKPGSLWIGGADNFVIGIIDHGPKKNITNVWEYAPDGRKNSTPSQFVSNRIARHHLWAGSQQEELRRLLNEEAATADYREKITRIRTLAEREEASRAN